MSSFTKVSWPMAQILEDSRSTSTATDFDLVQAAYSCVYYLPSAEQLEYLQQMESFYA